MQVKKKSNSKNYLIVALDTSDPNDAMNLIYKLKNQTSFFKVGLELFSACGPEIIKKIKDEGCKVFLDGKFLDIPNTVSKAVANVVRYKIDMLNVHLTGGIHMLQLAKEALVKTAKEINISPPKLLGVTVLTSIDENILQSDLRTQTELEEYVLHRAKVAKEANLDGIICSAHEVKKVRSEIKNNFLIVTPAIRPSWAESNDQKRVLTPYEAIKNGADYIVVGRPITHAKDPKEATRRILEEIEEAF